MEQNLNNSELDNNLSNKSKYSPAFKLKAGIFLASVSGISAIIGFGTTLAAAKKQDPKYFDKGLTHTIQLHENGAGLALRALGWGTLYAFTGCGILFYSIWKLSGAKTFEEFRFKIGSVLPKIPKNNPSKGRTEFSGINDLLDYLQHQKSSNDK